MYFMEEINSNKKPRDDNSDRHLTTLIKQIALAFVLVPASIIICIAFGIWLHAETVDQEESQQSIDSVQSHLDLSANNLGDKVKDYAWWSATVDNLIVKKNDAWLELHYRKYLYNNLGIDAILVFNAETRPIYAELHGKESA